MFLFCGASLNHTTFSDFFLLIVMTTAGAVFRFTFTIIIKFFKLQRNKALDSQEFISFKDFLIKQGSVCCSSPSGEVR